jgi:hypothetical protein
MPLSRLTQTFPLDWAAAISGLEAARVGAALACFGAAELEEEAGGALLELLLATGAAAAGALPAGAARLLSAALDLLLLLFLVGALEASALAG